jgi:archaellum component FlaC
MAKPVESYVSETIGSLVLQLANMQKQLADAKETIQSLNEQLASLHQEERKA